MKSWRGEKFQEMAGGTMYYEEFDVGDQFVLGPRMMPAEEIDEFARRYDPQWLHIDPDNAAHGPFRGVIASGFHTLSAVWGQWIASGQIGMESVGGTGLSALQWLYPVRAGDVLNTTFEVIKKVPSARGSRGAVTIRFTTTNQDGKVVMTCEGTVLIKAKDHLDS
jgi:acyl dehydratase